MKRFILALLLCTPGPLLAQDGNNADHGWGPGEVGDCLKRGSAEPSFYSWHDGVGYQVVGNSLYIEDESKACYSKSLDFHFEVVEAYAADESIIFWTGSESYRYLYETGTLEYFSPAGALSSFLFYPIVSFTALEGSYGCFGGNEESVTHDVIDLDAAVPSLRHEHKGEELKRRVHGGGVDARRMTRILRAVNADPNQLPSLGDFEITEGDIYRYGERFDTLADPFDLYNDYTFYLYDDHVSEDRVEYLSQLRNSFDTVSSSTVRAALVSNLSLWGSTSSYLVKGTVVNEIGDSLFISFRSNGPAQPYNLPLKVQYRGVEFQTFNAELGRLLSELLPKHEWRSEANQNDQLLVAVAIYLESLRHAED